MPIKSKGNLKKTPQLCPSWVHRRHCKMGFSVQRPLRVQDLVSILDRIPRILISAESLRWGQKSAKITCFIIISTARPSWSNLGCNTFKVDIFVRRNGRAVKWGFFSHLPFLTAHKGSCQKRRYFYGQADRKGWPPLPLLPLTVRVLWFFSK